MKEKKVIEGIRAGLKTRIPALVYFHNDHIDIDIDPAFMPFDVVIDEELKAGVKGYQKRGFHNDGKIHIWVRKK